jgi:hypothetical protein
LCFDEAGGVQPRLASANDNWRTGDELKVSETLVGDSVKREIVNRV